MCSPPPLPGAALPMGPAILFVKSVLLIVMVAPLVPSIPPPARLAVLVSMVAPVTDSVPPSARMPPPEPEAPSATLLEIVTLSVTVSDPPILNRPPPPLVASAPEAVLVSISVAPSSTCTVMVPVLEFQRPPPSDAAVLLVTVTSVNVLMTAPDICTAPPLPGAAVWPETGVVFAFNVVSDTVSVPATTSMPPPARLAPLVLMTESVIETAPSIEKTPPPEPDAPSALLLEISVPPSILSVPPLLKTPPPPSSAAGPEAVLFVIDAAVLMVMVPSAFQNAPPSRAAVFIVNVPPATVTSPPPPVTCKKPPFPGVLLAPSAVLLVAVTLLSAMVAPAPLPNSMAPPARLAVLLVKLPPFTVTVAAPLISMAPPENAVQPLKVTVVKTCVPSSSSRQPPSLLPSDMVPAAPLKSVRLLAEKFTPVATLKIRLLPCPLIVSLEPVTVRFSVTLSSPVPTLSACPATAAKVMMLSAESRFAQPTASRRETPTPSGLEQSAGSNASSTVVVTGQVPATQTAAPACTGPVPAIKKAAAAAPNKIRRPRKMADV